MYHAYKQAIEFHYLDMYVLLTKLDRIQLPELRFFDPIPLFSSGACLQSILYCSIFLFLHTTDPVAFSRSLAFATFVPFPIHLIVVIMSCLGLQQQEG